MFAFSYEFEYTQTKKFAYIIIIILLIYPPLFLIRFNIILKIYAQTKNCLIKEIDI